MNVSHHNTIDGNKNKVVNMFYILLEIELGSARRRSFESTRKRSIHTDCSPVAASRTLQE